MEGVIPNSRVVIHPPSDESDGTWRRELFLRPGEWIPLVTVTVIITTIVLAVIVFVLRLNEKVSVFFSWSVLVDWLMRFHCRGRTSWKEDGYRTI